MGISSSSFPVRAGLQESLSCCSQSYIVYTDSQLEMIRTHQGRLGLTRRQLDILISSWKSISPAMESQGGKLFEDIFQSNRELGRVFLLINPSLMGNIETKNINETLREHGVKPFLGMVEACLGQDYNMETQIVYKSVVDFLIQSLIDGYNGELRGVT